MIVAIHQPQYIPWIGYINKIANADIFVFLDTVQFKKNEWQNRNRIKTATGWQWMTVPVCYHYPQKISEVTINNKVRWGDKHWKTIVTNYSQTPYFQKYADFFRETLNREWTLLRDLNIHIIQFLAETWDLKTRLILASQLGIEEDDPTGRLISICQTLGGDTYLSGRDGVTYMNLDQFYINRIKICHQECHPEFYPQRFGEFIPHLSSIDLLFNCGPDGKDIVEASSDTSRVKKDQIYEYSCDRCPS